MSVDIGQTAVHAVPAVLLSVQYLQLDLKSICLQEGRSTICNYKTGSNRPTPFKSSFFAPSLHARAVESVMRPALRVWIY